MGLSLMITLQALINMMVSVGYFPVTGQTLPLISSRRFVCGIYEFVVGDYPRREPPDERAVARPPQRRVLAGVGGGERAGRTAVGTGIWKTVGLWRERP
ncbi:MAG: hypothetical protein ACLR8Y_00260 [Alistipes indistinctus]